MTSINDLAEMQLLFKKNNINDMVTAHLGSYSINLQCIKDRKKICGIKIIQQKNHLKETTLNKNSLFEY